MKKLILLSGVAVMTMMMSCKNEEPTPPVAPESTPIIVNEAAPLPPPPPPPREVEEDKDGTSVSVNSDGVSLDTKNGTRSTTVNVKDGGAAIEIKK